MIRSIFSPASQNEFLLQGNQQFSMSFCPLRTTSQSVSYATRMYSNELSITILLVVRLAQFLQQAGSKSDTVVLRDPYMLPDGR